MYKSIRIFTFILLALSVKKLVDSQAFAAANSLSQISNDDSRNNNNGPRITIYPKLAVFAIPASESATKSLTCKSEGDKPEMFSQLRWSGPNRFDNFDELAKRHRVFEAGGPNSNTWKLVFVNPTVDDSGTYYCRGSYQSSDSYNASANVKIEIPIKVENCPERQFIIRGDTKQKITCRITADTPAITIKKDGKHIESYGKRYKWDNDDGLEIDGIVDSSDSGEYVILIDSQLTGEFKAVKINVDVHSMPQIEPYNNQNEQASEFFGIEGRQANLECKASGNPQPLVYWLDPRRRNVTSVGGYIVNQEKGTLQINNVNRFNDNGQFECVAYNTVGSVSRKVSMAVYTRPNIVSFENKTVDENSEVTFECRATGEPKPDFSIRRAGNNQQPYRIGDGFVRDIDDRVEEAGSNVYIHRITVLATRSQFGMHYCNATNRADTAEAVGHLYVKHRPDLSQTPTEQFVKLGKEIIVTCKIKAYPAPTVTWSIDNTQIINPIINTWTSTDGQTHIVTMKPPNNQQLAFSRYKCEARNDMGNSEQLINVRYTTIPGGIVANLIERTPTTVKLQLAVPMDGGDRIKNFRYRAVGRTLDAFNPLYNFREDHQNETIIDASLSSSIYTIRNLLPFYAYTIYIRAVNEVGPGDITEIRVETLKPTRPDPPMIIKSGAVVSQFSSSATPSEYQNAYLLKWSPPDLDNGDPVTKYIIKINKVDTNAVDTSDIIQERTIEQMSERPMHAKLGPLEVNQRYKIQLQARNKYGDSDASYIIIYTTADRPTMPEYEIQALAWLIEPSTPTLIALLGMAVFFLILIDMVFCFCFQIGVTHMVRAWCCPPKTNSVISDKTYN